jgi:formylglycine-generating enzyme required for sulfatase activity
LTTPADLLAAALALDPWNDQLRLVCADAHEEEGLALAARWLRAGGFRRVPKGTFWMSKDEKNAQVQVTIKDDFELAAYTVTQEQWQTVMGNNPSWFSRQGLVPLCQVSSGRA